METVEQVLEHFGIKGMKWGVRRKRGPDGRVGGGSSDSGSSSSGSSSDRKRKLDSTSGRERKSLSNKQLKDAVERMNLEKQYSQLTGERAKPTKSQKLLEEGKKVAANVARQQVTNAANKVVGNYIDTKLKTSGLIPDPVQDADFAKGLREINEARKKK